MSACSSTLRALSRSRIPTTKTLLPFLYQTATIQQWKPAAQPIARRNISRYSRPDDAAAVEDIPFEDKDDLPPALDDLEPARKTTITGSERAAFEKLYRKFNARGSRQDEKDHEVEIDAIADEYWEPDDEDNPANLDKIFDEALKGNPNLAREWNRSSTEQLKSRKPRQDLQTMAQHILRGTRPPEMKRAEMRAVRKKDVSAKAAKLNEARVRERTRVDDLLKSAKTDRDLWDVLHREVFDLIRQLDLDGTNKPTPRKSRTPKSTNTTTDPKILFANYPHHLLTALTTLRTHFPASPLPLSILPTMKSLGRSSYALGATTALYTQLLRTAWLQQSSYPLLVSLLTDMHNGAIEFSVDTLHLLDQVIKEFDMARSGRLGREMQMVYGMDQFGEGIREVRRWRQIVASRVGVDDERREKGTVPVSRRRRAGDEDSSDHVPLVEGVNGALEPFQSHSQPRPADADVEFGFLGQDSAAEAPEAKEPIKSMPTADMETANNEAHDTVESKLEIEAADDANQEHDKSAASAEAAAKTSSGEFVPWTPS
ncbi:uncharacterized protein EKO05_0000302 [Ascochyta rabiei]|uniref:Mtf2-like C-terminal domain-containing protein n=1 Tax=Didymella rabiei TaxID=5454 RepID=A0A162VDX4_DIDRA|nr:uncharacterized protein EKO05_0000302 [Ascochyta rabiei]KZM18391.1 hypothetical protein ST47_g10494 [Ascochyta rabiei]UPX09615.1 hypothetical protein EKO05_0000302 [Ascochyta rabiei]